MPTYKLTSDTLRNGRITRRVTAANYPDALDILDQVVDQMDGLTPDVQNPPDTLTITELESGRWGAYANYVERFGLWQFVLKTGWFYTGRLGEETGRLCSPESKLDPVMMPR